MTADALASYYAARAPEYDAIYRKPERQDDLRAIERWLPPWFADARMLEIACGTGYWTQFLSDRAASIVAVDAAAETLRIACSRVGAPNVTFEVGDAYALPERLGRFDAAFAGFWFSHVPKARLAEFIESMHARLGRGARVVLLDNRYVEGSSTPIAERDADGNTYQVRELKDGSTHRVLKNFPSESDLRLLFADVAQDASFTDWPYYWAFEYRVG